MEETGTVFVFHFPPNQPYCPICIEPTEYYRTTEVRTINTLRYGSISFKESQVVCYKHRYRPEDNAPIIYGSCFARSLAPSRTRIGYDVIAEIGKKRFLDNRQIEEVVQDLSAQGITISGSCVSRWADYFAATVECLHHTKIRKLKRIIDGNGGYLLHIDDLRPGHVREHEDVLALRLIIDVLDYTQDGDGLDFPFDLYRVYFVTRLNRLRLRLMRYHQRHPRTIGHCLYLPKLERIASRVSDHCLRQHVQALGSIHQEFNALRTVLRFEIKKGRSLVTTMSMGTLSEIRSYNRGLIHYTKRLCADKKKGQLSPAQGVILNHLITYQFKLPIPEQLVAFLAYLDRTNNFEESLFRGIKRGQRRQVGKKDISREFSLHGPYLPLMENLRNDDYIAAMIGDMKDLPLQLSQLDSRDITHYLQKLKENRRGKFFSFLKKMDGISLLPGYL